MIRSVSIALLAAFVAAPLSAQQATPRGAAGRSRSASATSRTSLPIWIASLAFYRDVLGLEVYAQSTVLAERRDHEARRHTGARQSRLRGAARCPASRSAWSSSNTRTSSASRSGRSFVDPGAANISMRVRDLDALFPKIVKVPGVKVLTAGGKPATLDDPERDAARRVRAGPGRLRGRAARSAAHCQSGRAGAAR